MSDDDTEVLVCETTTKTEYLFSICPDLYKLSGEHTKVQNMIASLAQRYITIKGHVQSGKTKFMICASSLFLKSGYSVIIILRNNKADQEQIHERLMLFAKQMEVATKSASTFTICKTSRDEIVIGPDKPRIYLTLGNNSSTKKIMTELEGTHAPYILFIDEVDYVDSGEGSKKNEIIPLLKQRAHCIFGVSATIMDPMGKEHVLPSDILLLSVSPHYKGIPSLVTRELSDHSVFTSSVDGDLFESDEDLMSFVEDFSKEKGFPFVDREREDRARLHPPICLVNICRTKEPTLRAQQSLHKRFPHLHIIVYNGNGIFYTHRDTQEWFQCSISSFLQRIKDSSEDIQPILIFSGELAGRGISFTSADFEWHLTSLRLLVASHTVEPELIQRVRLCGVYHDDIPLTLYSTAETLSDLRKAYFRQEELICSLKKNDETDIRTCRTLLENMEMNCEKFTRRSMVKDRSAAMVHFDRVQYECGWKMSVYTAQTQLLPAEAYRMYGMEGGEETESFKRDISEHMIVLGDIEHPKYIKMYEAIVAYLAAAGGSTRWVSRGRIREDCREDIPDVRDLGRLQRYSQVYEGEQGRQLIWRKVKREYEYKLVG